MSSSAFDTLHLLERRIDRLAFYLEDPTSIASVGTPNEPSQEVSVIDALTRLQSRFDTMCSKYPQAGNLLRLHATLPDSFEREDPDGQPIRIDGEQLPIVLSSERLFQPTASQLTELQQHSIPNAAALVELISLRPKLIRAMMVEEELVKEVEELRRRSASLLEHWYESAILKSGQRWVDWEGRLSSVELALRRQENARTREEGEVGEA